MGVNGQYKVHPVIEGWPVEAIKFPSKGTILILVHLVSSHFKSSIRLEKRISGVSVRRGHAKTVISIQDVYLIYVHVSALRATMSAHA